MSIPYITEMQYPKSLLYYERECSEKINSVLRELATYDSEILNDLNGNCKVTELSCTAEPKVMLLSYFESYYKTMQKPEYDCKITLKYQLDLYWRVRPGQYSDFYVNKCRDLLYTTGFDFSQGPIVFEYEESTGQHMSTSFFIDCSKEISYEKILEIVDEYKSLNNI